MICFESCRVVITRIRSQYREHEGYGFVIAMHIYFCGLKVYGWVSHVFCLLNDEMFTGQLAERNVSTIKYKSTLMKYTSPEL
jgi:hypothetical protein